MTGGALRVMPRRGVIASTQGRGALRVMLRRDAMGGARVRGVFRVMLRRDPLADTQRIDALCATLRRGGVVARDGACHAGSTRAAVRRRGTPC